MKIHVNYHQGQTVLDLMKEEDKKKFIYCRIDGRVRELTYPFQKDGEADIELLDLTDSESTKIYATSLRFLVALAIKEISPKMEVRFFYNISRSIFGKIIRPKGYKPTAEFIKKLNAKVQELIQADLKIERFRLTKDEAMKIYKENGNLDKYHVLRYKKSESAHIYKCVVNGKEYYDYLYSFMVPSTGYLTKYILRPYTPGFLINVPRSECGGEIPPFSNELKFADTLQRTSGWSELNELSTAYDINSFIKKNDAMSLINVSEARINNLLAEVGLEITGSVNPIKLVCIAGPSSSGKTSFANRLMFELMSRGMKPIRISLDDFYIPRHEMNPGTDLESVDALDVPLFLKDMNALIDGEEVSLPVYDFHTGERSFAKPFSISEKQIIIIEGIHALNKKMTEGIPEYQKYKIYIAPQPQVNIDNHTPISMTDLRLIRRITRDARTRSSDASETISMWPNVRAGEFKYIYPTQENADFVFDSFLPYEPCVLKSYALPLLNKVGKEDPYYIVARRLVATLEYFISIPANDIPCNSLMREFVGGSSFKDAR